MTRTHRSLEGRGLVPIHRVRHDLVPMHPGVLRELSLREDHLDSAGPRAPRARVLRGHGEVNEPSRRPKPAAAGAIYVSRERAVARSRRMMMMVMPSNDPPFATPADARLGAMDEPDDLADEAEAPADARDLYANLGRACSTSPRFRSGRPSSPRNGNGTLLLLTLAPAPAPPPPQSDAMPRTRTSSARIVTSRRSRTRTSTPPRRCERCASPPPPPPLPRRLGPPAAVRFSLRRRRTRVHLERASAPVSSLAPGTSTPPPPPRSPRPPSSLPASTLTPPSPPSSGGVAELQQAERGVRDFERP
jgi:hypothetical protein